MAPEPKPVRRASFKIVVRRVEKPFSHGVDKELDWLCNCLGFFEPIDREKTAASVFKEIIKGAERSKPLTSTALAKRVEMSRGSVINHLNNMLRSGLVVREGRFYMPRSRSMFRTIEEIEEDIERIFQRMKKTAKEIDEEFGIKIDE
jgi:predicted transcriptional regulator